MRNRLWVIILAAALLCTLSPLPALADEAPVFYIGGVCVTLPGPGGYVWGDDSGGSGQTKAFSGWTWRASYTGTKIELVLRNAKIDRFATVTPDAGDDSFIVKAAIYADRALSIELDGGGAIDVSGEKGAYGVYVRRGALSVEGGVGATLTVDSDQSCFYAPSSVSMAKVNVVADSGQYYGVLSANDISVTGGSLTATGWTALWAVGGDVKLKNAQVRAEGVSTGVQAENVSVEGGSLTAKGASGYGVSADGWLKSSNAKVTANGGFGGVYAKGDVVVTGGSLDATGTSNAGVYAQNGGVTFKDGGDALRKTVVTASGGTYGIAGVGKNGLSLDDVLLTARGGTGATDGPLKIGNKDGYRWRASDQNADPGGALISSSRRAYQYLDTVKYLHIEAELSMKILGNVAYGDDEGSVYRAGDDGEVKAVIGAGTTITPANLVSVQMIRNGAPKMLTEKVHYIVGNGSIIITLLPSYLKTLTPGTYTLRAQLTDPPMDVDAPLTVLDNAPKTGDGAPLTLWAALTALGVGGAAWAGRKRRRTKES